MVHTLLYCSQHQEEEPQQILLENVEIAVAALRKRKSAGVDNIPAELVQAGGETLIDVLTKIVTGEWLTLFMDSVAVYYIP